MATANDASKSVLDRLIKLPKSWTNNPERKLIHEGILMMEEDRKLKPRWCLLFNDIFLITKPQCDFIENDTKLKDEKSELKFKNFLFLRSCYIDESPKTVKHNSHCKHETYPFVLIGENPLNHKNLQIAMSCKNIHDRQNWLKIAHRAIIKIHASTFNDFERYAWENVYRRGTLFHAMYASNIKLLNTLIDTLLNQNTNDVMKTINGMNATTNATNNKNNKNNDKNDKKNNKKDKKNNKNNKENTNNNNNVNADTEMKDEEFETRFRQASTIHTKIESLLDEGGHNLLHIAAYKNNVEFIRKYGGKFAIDLPDQNGWTPLRIACDNGNYASISALIDLNANVEECYPEDRKANPYIRKAMHDRTLLHEFTQRGDMTIVKMLLNCNVDIETCDSKGLTPLHLACKTNNELIALLLLRQGAPTNLPDFLTNRPLHLATDEKVARWLVVYGARTDLTNNQAQPASRNLGNKLDKYNDIYASLAADDCEQQGEPIDETGWFDDKLSEQCLACKDKFTMRNRRHHCRKCGLLVCGLCSAKKLIFIKEDKPTPMRVCDKCYNVAHTQCTDTTKYVIRPCDYLAKKTMNLTQQGSYNSQIYSFEALSKEPTFVTENEDDEKHNKSHSVMQAIANKFGNHGNHGTHGVQKSESDALKHKNNTKGNKNNNKHHVYSKTETAEVKNAKDLIAQANAKALERGDKLNELADKSERLADNAKSFNQMAEQLARKKW